MSLLLELIARVQRVMRSALHDSICYDGGTVAHLAIKTHAGTNSFATVVVVSAVVVVS
jgi:hypothetical protein